MGQEISSNKVVLILSDHDAFVDRAGEVFSSGAFGEVDVAACSVTEILDCAMDVDPYLILLDLVKSKDPRLDLLKEIHDRFSSSTIIFVGVPQNGSLVVDLVNHGFDHFLKSPLDANDLKPFFPKAVDEVPEEAPAFVEPETLILAPEEKPKNTVPHKRTKTIVLLSPKGGSGASLLAANLGVALAENFKNKVIVCDLISQCGDPATYLNISPHYNIRNLIEKSESLDEDYLDGVIEKHSSGLHLLSGPDMDDSSFRFAEHPKEFQSILFLMKSKYDVILIDAGSAEGDLLQMILMQSDMVLLVGTLDIPSLKGLTVFYNRIRHFDFKPEQIKIIINRFNAKHQLDLSAFEKNINHPISHHIPNNYGVCSEAVNSGRSFSEIDPHADITLEMSLIAGSIQNGGQAPTEGTNAAVTESRSFKARLAGLMKGKAK
jgi:pilus assembly protein CpaE